jgi:hypothetical protein
MYQITGVYISDARNFNTETGKLKFRIYSSHMLSKATILPIFCTGVKGEFMSGGNRKTTNILWQRTQEIFYT